MEIRQPEQVIFKYIKAILKGYGGDDMPKAVFPTKIGISTKDKIDIESEGEKTAKIKYITGEFINCMV